jgi:hypothetical protein
MPDKPFIAARIPEDLNHALNQHVEQSGENRTEALISALGQYLKFTPGNLSQNKAATKIDSLVERIARLEEIILGKPEPRSVIDYDNRTDNTLKDSCELEIRVKSDNADNTIITTGTKTNESQVNTSPVINLDNITPVEVIGNVGETQASLFQVPLNGKEVLSNKEIAEAVERSNEWARIQHKKGQSIIYGTTEYVSRKDGRSITWIQKTSNNTDNDESISF